MMVRLIAAAGLAASFLFIAPAFAATSKEKMETCNFGADDQKLTGAARKSLHGEVHVEQGLAARQAGEARAQGAIASRPGGGSQDPRPKRPECGFVLAAFAVDQIPVLAL